MRIAFIHTPDDRLARTQQYGAMFMPVWAYTLAAYIEPEKHELKLFDLRFDEPEDVSAADLFVFSGINQDYETIAATHATLHSRYPDATFVIGGPITWSLNQAGEVAKLEMFDHVFIGDGEIAFPRFLENFATRSELPKVLETRERFDVTQARGFYRPFLDATHRRYYGGVLEVSRGCPFLCEFCDIRVLPDNNRPHNFSPDHIVSELDNLARLGIRQVLFAADNFIGDLRWAEQLLDRIIAWQEQSGKRVALYTWLTINISKHPKLLRKLREANFDMLFIGVESFSNNSLLETAKVQNTAGDMVTALREIQSYGFAVVAGLIFGFDSDKADAFDIALEGMQQSGLISGDPSLLTALPGTPLYRRMKLSGRLRTNKNSLGGYKYCTNIRYLLPRDEIVRGYQSFVTRFCQGRYQYQRLKQFIDNLDRGNYIPLKSAGYGSLSKYVSMVFKSPGAVKMLAQRLVGFVTRPSVAWYSMRAAMLVARRSWRHPRLFGVFQFWLFNWTNAMLKYQGLGSDAFDIESVPADFDRSLILPVEYAESANEPIPQDKIAAQQRATLTQLRRLVAAE